MAKKDLIKVCFVLAAVSTLGSTSAFAASSINGPITLGGGTFSPSKSVTIAVVTGNGTNATCVADASASNPCNNYGARSKHASGDKIFGALATEPKTFYQSCAVTASVGTASLTENFSAWTAL